MIERALELAEVLLRQLRDRRLRRGSMRRSKCIPRPSREHGEKHNQKQSVSLHGALPATSDAIHCGNRKTASTTRVASQSRMALKRLARRLQLLARCCCQKPKARKTGERPRNQIRYLTKNIPAPAAPSAAKNPTGRQQPSVASAAVIAATGAAHLARSLNLLPRERLHAARE